MEALYEGICAKNGDPVHDKVVDIFMFEEKEIQATYWFESEPTYRSASMLVPQGTIVT